MNGNERSVQKMNGNERNVLNGNERDAQPWLHYINRIKGETRQEYVSLL